MHETTKTILLDRVFRLNKNIPWNEEKLNSLEEEIDSLKLILEGQRKERSELIEDLKATGVEVDVPVQD